MKTVEYRIRPIVRYIVTRWENETLANGNSSGLSEQLGEYENHAQALRVMDGIGRSEAIAAQCLPETGTDSIAWSIPTLPGDKDIGAGALFQHPNVAVA